MVSSNVCGCVDEPRCDLPSDSFTTDALVPFVLSLHIKTKKKMNFCNVENQTRPYEGNAQKLSLKWSHVRFLLILPLSLKDPVLAMMHCSLGGIGKQKPRYHVNQSNAREKHYGQYWAFKCYSLHVQCNRTFPYSTSVLTNDSTRARLGWRF